MSFCHPEDKKTYKNNGGPWDFLLDLPILVYFGGDQTSKVPSIYCRMTRHGHFTMSGVPEGRSLKRWGCCKNWEVFGGSINMR